MKSAMLLALSLIAAVPATAKALPLNLVVNGSFEKGLGGIGSFQGWQTSLGDSSTYVDSSGKTGTSYGQATDGLWAAYFGSTQASGGSTISQTLATTANQLYVFSFDVANDNAGPPPSNSFTALIAGFPIFTVSNLLNQGFIHEQFSFVAKSSATTLQFSAFNDQSYTELDNVAVIASTPEPSSFALLFTGVFLCVGLRWASRSTAYGL